MILAEQAWQERLAEGHPDREAAIAELRETLLTGLRAAMQHRADVDEAHLQDFAQDATLRVLERLGQFAGKSRFTTWAHSIAINTAMTELRRKRWQDVPLDTLLEDARQLCTTHAMPENSFTGNEDRQRVVAALRRAIAGNLSEKQRAVISSMLQGMPFDQVMSLLGTNRNAGYKLVHDARVAIKDSLVREGIRAEDIRNAFET